MSVLQRSSPHSSQRSGAVAIILAVLGAIVLLTLGVTIWWLLANAPATNSNALNNQEIIPINSTNQSTNKPVQPTPTNSPVSTPNNANETNNSSVPTPNNTSESTNSATNSTSGVENPCPEAGACNAEAQVLCPDEWKGTSVEASYKIDLVNCLYDEHKDELSAECLDSLECRQQLNDDLNAACREDRIKFCAGVKPSPGSEPMVDCLGEHFPQLSPDCAEAWLRHDAAKPEGAN